MVTLVLGGGSFKNKLWVDETKAALSSDFPCEAVYWNDWANEQDAKIDLPVEITKASEVVEDQPFNLLAKSVGSYVGLGMVKDYLDQVQKIIIVGVPLHDFEREDLKNQYQAVLASFPAERLLVMQNEFDNHGSYEEVVTFMNEVNPEIKVVKKTNPEFISTHNYPYTGDFRKFLL